MAKTQRNESKNIIHPGYVLKRELAARRIKQKDFAAQIAIQPSHLSEIIRGKRNVTEQIAIKLECALNVPADNWLALQAEYEYRIKAAYLRNIEDKEASLQLAEYDSIVELKEIFKAVGLTTKSAVEKLNFCKEKLNFISPALQKRALQGCYHRSEKTGLDSRMIATWSVLAKYEASMKPIPSTSFDVNKVDELASKLRDIFNENHNTINRVERILYNYGIIFCVVPKVKHASVDGYSFSIKGIPAIVVTKRFNRIDNVAFAVMHEIGHLKLHASKDGNGNINLPYNDAEAIPQEEREANEFASNALIPHDLWLDMPSMPMNPRTIQRLCTGWAKKHNINKWIVLGRVSHETGMYMFRSDSSREIN